MARCSGPNALWRWSRLHWALLCFDRYWRLEIRSRHVSPQTGSHSWLKEVLFGQALQSPTVATDYTLMYLPYTSSGSRTGLTIDATFDPVSQTASASWLAANDLTPATLASGAFKATLPQAAFGGLGASTPFDAFGPMELTASAASVAAVLSAHPEPVLFFPETRELQVAMPEAIPQRWADAGPSNSVNGTATPDETFAFQIGVWAVRANASFGPSDIGWTDLVPAGGGGGGSIPADAVVCHNLGGVNYRGQPFSQTATVAKGTVGSLWFSVGVPASTAAGEYSGTVTVTGQKFAVTLTVAGAPLPNSGADDEWRMARLRWLDSTLGFDRNVTAEHVPVALTCGASGGACGATVSNNRTVTVSPTAAAAKAISVLEQVGVGGQHVLVSPLEFAVDGESWGAGAVTVLQHDNVSATLSTRTVSVDGGLVANVTSEINFDGFVNTVITLTPGSGQSKQLTNASLRLRVAAAASTYFMGLGRDGDDRTTAYPSGTQWTWRANGGAQNQLWAGSTVAGLRLKFKGDSFDWESPLHIQQVR